MKLKDAFTVLRHGVLKYDKSILMLMPSIKRIVEMLALVIDFIRQHNNSNLSKSSPWLLLKNGRNLGELLLSS